MAAQGAMQGASASADRLDEDAPSWAWAAIGVILGLAAARLALLALEFAPLHFDEAQYWTYGEALDWGYYSKPPMIAWIIRASTDLLGDTAFGVRAASPVIHGLIAWGVFAIARRLFDARTGFWAALTYLLLPGVTVGAALMTTDTPMMAGWTLALYALVRAVEPGGQAAGGRLVWWALFGAGIGLGLLSKYTIIALPAGAIGFALFARQGGPRPLRLGGPFLAALTAALVWSPNLWWNAQNHFASILHVADNAKLGDGPAYDVGKMAEFVGAQLGVFGPVTLIALIVMLASRGWRREWAYRLLLWVSLPLLLAMIGQSFLSRAHPNWAAPAYIGLSIAVSAWLLDIGRRVWLRAALGLGLAVFIGFGAYGLYLESHRTELPRIADMFKKLRPGPAVCDRALPLRGDRKLFSADRRLLADCMFKGKLGLDDIRILTLGAPGNHYQLVAPLTEADVEPMLMVHVGPRAYVDAILNFFAESTVLEEGEIQLHADRSVYYFIAAVKGPKGLR